MGMLSTSLALPAVRLVQPSSPPAPGNVRITTSADTRVTTSAATRVTA